MSAPARSDGRPVDGLRPISFEVGVQRHAAGSVLIKWGHTHVICSASVEDRVPPHRAGSGGGWLTAEYAMLPGAGRHRGRRERPSVSGRSAEIQRLIARSLRAAVDLDQLGSRTITVDCDVLQADGGTRCASITGGWVATALALRKLAREGQLIMSALPEPVAAVSMGLLDTPDGEQVLVDLEYTEDVAAEVDLNFVATPAGLVEIQGTAEGRPFSREVLDRMVDRGLAACGELFRLQKAVL